MQPTNHGRAACSVCGRPSPMAATISGPSCEALTEDLDGARGMVGSRSRTAGPHGEPARSRRRFIEPGSYYLAVTSRQTILGTPLPREV
jgi:hypothetical protein